MKTVPVTKTALDFDGPGLPLTGLEVILPLFPGREALIGPVLVQRFQNTAEPNESSPARCPSPFPLSCPCIGLCASQLQAPRFSAPTWQKAFVLFWPIPCHFSELHQLGLRLHEHQDQPKGCKKNKIGGEVRPSSFSGSELMMKLHPLLSQILLHWNISH